LTFEIARRHDILLQRMTDINKRPKGHDMTPTIRAIWLGLLLALPGLIPTASLAQEGYRISAGDTLRIEVLEDAGLNRTVLVAPDGRISMPLAGSIRAAGQSVEQVQAALSERLAGNFAAAPNVFVSVERLAERRPAAAPTGPAAPDTVAIYVMGEAAKPGRIDVERGTTVLQLFAQMGGFSKFAATKRIQLRRMENGAEKIYPFNYELIEAGSAAGNTTVLEGDVLVIPQRKLFE
jgi:polysaccharide biosynthesis/export protein